MACLFGGMLFKRTGFARNFIHLFPKRIGEPNSSVQQQQSSPCSRFVPPAFISDSTKAKQVSLGLIPNFSHPSSHNTCTMRKIIGTRGYWNSVSVMCRMPSISNHSQNVVCWESVSGRGSRSNGLHTSCATRNIENSTKEKICTKSSGISLTVSPSSCLVDVSLDVNVRGLQPTAPYTLAAMMKENAVSAASYAHFMSDSSGEIATSRMPSQGGSYLGVEPTGLLWAMDVVPGQKPGRRVMKRDVTEPYEVKYSVFPGHVNPVVPVDQPDVKHSEPVAQGTQKRWYLADGVKRCEVRDGRIRGTFFIPPGKGPFPAVIDMFGTAGGLLEFRAALLASRGIAALALPYFNFEDLPTDLKRLDLEYFGEAVDWLHNQPEVFKYGVGTVGVSAGAILAVVCAEYFPKVKAVVSINGGNSNYAAALYLDGKLSKELALPDWASCCEFMEEKDNALMFKDAVLHLDNDDIEKCTLHPEKSDAAFLIIAGGDDVNTTPMASQLLYDRMVQKGKTNCELVVYEKAGHLIEPPFTMHCFYSHHKNYGTNFAWGGEKVAHARAQELSWARILEFIKSNLSKPVPSKL